MRLYIVPHGDSVTKEIEPDRPRRPHEKLLIHRLVQPQPAPFEIYGFLIHDSPVSGQAHFHHIAGNHAHQDENDERHAHEGGKHQENSADKVSVHGIVQRKGAGSPRRCAFLLTVSIA